MRSDLIEKKEKLQKQLARIEEQLKNLENLPDDHQFAVYLHEKLCRFNHTDGCSWFYNVNMKGVHDWNGHAHKKWLSIAQKILDRNYNPDHVKDILEIIYK